MSGRLIATGYRVWRQGLVRWAPLLILAAGWWISDPDSTPRTVTSVLAALVAALLPRCACHERSKHIERHMEDWDAAFSAIMPDGQPPRGRRARAA